MRFPCEFSTFLLSYLKHLQTSLLWLLELAYGCKRQWEWISRRSDPGLGFRAKSTRNNGHNLVVRSHYCVMLLDFCLSKYPIFIRQSLGPVSGQVQPSLHRDSRTRIPVGHCGRAAGVSASLCAGKSLICIFQVFAKLFLAISCQGLQGLDNYSCLLC